MNELTMNRDRAFVITLLVIFVGPVIFGCLPVPVKRTVVVIPETEVTVTDADSAQPVEGATVFLRREHLGPPPRELLDTALKLTDGQGRVSFEQEEVRETHMPLMMHGVPQRRFTICVSHPGYQTELTDWETYLVETGGQLSDDDLPWILDFALETGEPSDCPDIEEHHDIEE